MQDNTLVILALVGLAVICLGLFVVLFLTIFRFTGRNFMGFLALLMRNSKDDDDNQPRVIKPPKADLRSMAEAEDFDSALARHIVQDEIEPQAARSAQRKSSRLTPPTDLSATAQADSSENRPFEDVAPRLGSRRMLPRRPLDSDSDDDPFGDLLDGDLGL